jgi:hypothetical protein
MKTRTETDKALRLLDGLEKLEASPFFDSKIEYIVSSYYKKQNYKAGYKMAFVSLSILIIVNIISFINIKRKNINTPSTTESFIIENSANPTSKYQELY